MSTLEFITFSKLINNIDAGDTLKKKSDYNYIDLEKLVNAFKLDFEYDPPDYHPYGNRPGFISKKYYQSKPELGYNYPPEGPIPVSFRCTYCKKSGPEYHGITCKRPFESSLVLTENGTKNYPGIEKDTNYLLVVKKTGQKKIVSTNIRSEKFSDSVQLLYENTSLKKTRILISRNGVVNIISAADYSNTLENSLIDKINKSGALTPNYPGGKFMIDPSLSYVYLILAQFYLIDKDKNTLDLRSFNNYLEEYKNELEEYEIDNYQFNTGSTTSRNNVLTNPFIKFDLVVDNTKINVMIYNKGTVQIRASNTSKKNRNNVEKDTIKTIYPVLKELFNEIIQKSKEDDNEIVTDLVPKPPKIKFNTVDGKQPQKCAERGGLRPVPYSFYGKCPLDEQYVRPEGIKRDDGLYEPCCYKKKDSGKDGKKRIQNILINGYPDAEAIKFNEIIPDPDDKTSIYKPGTKIRESRRRPGLNDFTQKQLIKCIEDSGYIKKDNVFKSNESEEDYDTLKAEVFDNYSSLTGTKNILKQIPVVLTNTNFDNFTKKRYMVCPIYPETIYTLLYFDEHGESYFLNLNKEISQSGLPTISELKNTIISGYLLPFEEPKFIFYFGDLLFYKSTNVMNNKFFDNTNKNRYFGLKYVFNKIQDYNEGPLTIQLKFDQNIIKGSNHYSDKASLLYIPYDSIYTPNRINKEVMIWNDSLNLNNLYIGLNVKKSSKNRWSVSIDSKEIPGDLLPQLNSTIEITIKFTDDNKIKDNDHILFKIMLNNITKKIATQKPLVALEKLDEQINDYSDVIGILQSIQNPIEKQTFRPTDFKVGADTYISESVDRPLIKS